MPQCLSLSLSYLSLSSPPLPLLPFHHSFWILQTCIVYYYYLYILLFAFCPFCFWEGYLPATFPTCIQDLIVLSFFPVWVGYASMKSKLDMSSSGLAYHYSS